MMTVLIKLLLVTAPVWAVLWRLGLFKGQGQWSLVLGLSIVIGTGLAGLSMWFGLMFFDGVFGYFPEVLVWLFCLLSWVVLSQWLTIHSTGFHSPPNPPLERSVLSWLDYAWIVFFVFLITTRIYHLFSEVTLSRIFPWDAWLVWAYEARVWLEQGVYVEFLPPSHLLTAPKDAWVGATTVFYPKIIPALIFWLHQGTTEWLHVPVGLLWLWVAISISLMLFRPAPVPDPNPQSNLPVVQCRR